MPEPTPSVFRRPGGPFVNAPSAHRIADISYKTTPFVLCTCGWRTVAMSSLELEFFWKRHRTESK